MSDQTEFYTSDGTPDICDSLESLWDHFAAGLIYDDHGEGKDESFVDCPFCNEDYNLGRGEHVYCDYCRLRGEAITKYLSIRE